MGAASLSSGPVAECRDVDLAVGYFEFSLGEPERLPMIDWTPQLNHRTVVGPVPVGGNAMKGSLQCILHGVMFSTRQMKESSLVFESIVSYPFPESGRNATGVHPYQRGHIGFNSVSSVTSGGQFSRTGGLITPRPRLVYTCSRPTRFSPV
jgi:hypothetical protein